MTIIPQPTTLTFTAEFTGQLGSLLDYRFKPMVPVVKGHAYIVTIGESGVTRFDEVKKDDATKEPVALDPDGTGVLDLAEDSLALTGAGDDPAREE